ncbi:FtsW/RodA/SpoVE family cell cycle protein [Anaerotalea alkaliphila]|uniref:Probable peptidoglycan glycosyltransferase FtsW n=1 Tax=Anaerotalea alkaliphila TaxID=2662126 RepID=A0A7X5HT20_9FIRM|nr:putative peptidoglycan glycosyltransferase FtsW [Anaerotalea alkaliphila]NDL66143.1 cell division protein FtsW [Anaerotalea alkaliphila]
MKRKNGGILMLHNRTDVSFLFVIAFLVSFGIIMVFSSSYYAYDVSGGSTPLWVKQAVFALLGFVAMLLVSYVRIELIKKFVPMLYVMAMLLLVLVLLVGKTINGAKRWLSVMGINIQPSEFAKVVLILTLAVFLAAFTAYLSKFRVLALFLVLVMLPAYLIGRENLSGALIILAIAGGMLFAAHPKIIQVVGAGILFLLLGAGAYSTRSYRGSRMTTFLEGPWSDPLGKGRQTIQSLYAIGSGGVFGIGLGQGIQKMGYISEAHNDIIFAVICEELGLVGGFIVLLLYGLLIYRCFVIARNAMTKLDLLLVAGVATHIATQVVINIAVATNTMPTTGIPLPFISYGGSSLLIFLVEMGLVLNVARHTDFLKERERRRRRAAMGLTGGEAYGQAY